MTDKEKLKKKLEENSVRDERTGCLLWSGHKDHGYGRLGFPGWVWAHRASAYVHGLIESLKDKRDVLHNIECKNRHCIEITHLHTGTNADNMRDKVIARTHCNRGLHEYTPENIELRGKSGQRACKLCRRESAKNRYHLKKKKQER